MRSPIIDLGTELLLSMYSPELKLFSSSTRMVDSGYRNEFDLPAAFRYSTVSLLGLQNSFQALREEERFLPLLDAFTKRHWMKIDSVGDLGVLCSMLHSVEHPLQADVLAAIRRRCGASNLMSTTTAQEICQLLIAVCEMQARRPSEQSETLARQVWSQIRAHFYCEQTGFCFHNSSRIRRPFVSFGATTYFLRALHDYGRTFDDEKVKRTFESVLGKIVALQGPRGEWPWFLDARRGRVAEWYEVYSVHQHSMAFLFLFPALADGHDLAQTVRRSYQWIFGQNELNTPMFRREPFFIYRSIRRKEKQAHARRFARAAATSWLGRAPSFAHRENLEINTECRSYEIGWLLYVWAAQSEFQDFQWLQTAASDVKLT